MMQRADLVKRPLGGTVPFTKQVRRHVKVDVNNTRKITTSPNKGISNYKRQSKAMVIECHPTELCSQPERGRGHEEPPKECPGFLEGWKGPRADAINPFWGHGLEDVSHGPMLCEHVSEQSWKRSSPTCMYGAGLPSVAAAGRTRPRSPWTRAGLNGDVPWVQKVHWILKTSCKKRYELSH